MTNLDIIENQIEQFLQKSIDDFKIDNPFPKSIGIYCCPWAGWLTSNFNLNKAVSDTNNNCPDFEFVEFDFLELPELSVENENENSTFSLKNELLKVDKDLGDEGLNSVIFEFLKPIAKRIKDNNDIETVLQMLDSKFVESIK